jgi:hypothetical protein
VIRFIVEDHSEKLRIIAKQGDRGENDFRGWFLPVLPNSRFRLALVYRPGTRALHGSFVPLIRQNRVLLILCDKQIIQQGKKHWGAHAATVMLPACGHATTSRHPVREYDRNRAM